MDKVDLLKEKLLKIFKEDLDRYFEDVLHCSYGEFNFMFKMRDHDITICEASVKYQKKV